MEIVSPQRSVIEEILVTGVGGVAPVLPDLIRHGIGFDDEYAERQETEFRREIDREDARVERETIASNERTLKTVIYISGAIAAIALVLKIFKVW